MSLQIQAIVCLDWEAQDRNLLYVYIDKIWCTPLLDMASWG